MSIQEDWHDEDQKPRGMSSTTKVLLTLAGIGGLCLLLCCGGLFFAGFKIQQFAKDAVKDDPESVREVTEEIIEIDIPADFEPKKSVDAFVMKMVAYEHKTDKEASLMIAEFNASFGTNTEQQREQMLEAMRQQSHQQAPAGVGNHVTETREFEIDGETIAFQFVTWTPQPDGRTRRQITGMIPTRQGFVMLAIVAPEDVLDDEKVEALLKSIHVPDGAASTDKPSAEKPAVEKPAVEKTVPENQPVEKPMPE